MSWSWREKSEEREEYDVQGTVTISTKEYRDLIEENADLYARGQKEHDDWYNEVKKNDELKKKVEVLEEKLASYKDYIESSDIRMSDYNKYRLTKIDEADE